MTFQFLQVRSDSSRLFPDLTWGGGGWLGLSVKNCTSRNNSRSGSFGDIRVRSILAIGFDLLVSFVHRVGNSKNVPESGSQIHLHTYTQLRVAKRMTVNYGGKISFRFARSQKLIENENTIEKPLGFSYENS